jgi:hypothetical protein
MMIDEAYERSRNEVRADDDDDDDRCMHHAMTMYL